MNMMKLVAGISLGLLVSTANAGITYTPSPIDVYTTTLSGATVVDFNDGTCGAYTACSGNGHIVSGSVSGYYATPYGITDNYVSVPRDNGSGEVLFTLDGAYDYYGLFWGSVDTYNTISFFLDGSLVGSFGGSDLSPLLADGNQGSWTSNRYVNFTFTDGDMFDQVLYTSNGYAFETDNHAFGNIAVPEPSTLFLFGIGLLGLGYPRFKRAR